MDIIECKKCGNLIERGEQECAVCGQQVPPEPQGNSGRVKKVSITKIQTTAQNKPGDKVEVASVKKAPEQLTGKNVSLGSILLAAMLCFWFFGSSSSRTPVTSPAVTTAPIPANPSMTSNVCGSDDVQCLGEKYRSRVLPDCIALIESRAQYSYRWIDGLSNGPKLSHDYMTGVPISVVVYSGDNIELQNGFGAWKRMYYQCWFDTEKMSIVHIVLK